MTQDEARAKWLAVLRDPESKKHTKVLENANRPWRRCCLGHACHALGIKRTIKDRSVAYGDKPNRHELPYEAQKMLGINGSGEFRKSVVVDDIRVGTLIQLNDEFSLKTNQMADLIEKQFEQDNFVLPTAWLE